MEKKTSSIKLNAQIKVYHYRLYNYNVKSKVLSVFFKILIHNVKEHKMKSLSTVQRYYIIFQFFIEATDIFSYEHFFFQVVHSKNV